VGTLSVDSCVCVEHGPVLTITLAARAALGTDAAVLERLALRPDAARLAAKQHLLADWCVRACVGARMCHACGQEGAVAARAGGCTSDCGGHGASMLYTERETMHCILTRCIAQPPTEPVPEPFRRGYAWLLLELQRVNLDLEAASQSVQQLLPSTPPIAPSSSTADSMPVDRTHPPVPARATRAMTEEDGEEWLQELMRMCLEGARLLVVQQCKILPSASPEVGKGDVHFYFYRVSHSWCRDHRLFHPSKHSNWSRLA
jgi:hypothetical protein